MHGASGQRPPLMSTLCFRKVVTIIQEEETGCGIASVANIVERPYAEVKAKANTMGIFAEDEALYSDTEYVRRLLREYGIRASNVEVPFSSWASLPDIGFVIYQI